MTRNIPELLTIIVPRHPIRGEDIASRLRSAGHKIARRAADEPVQTDTGIYVVDTVGELGLIYRLATVAFIGGSLVPHGGQNLLEAAKLDCAIVHGPWMTNFTAIVSEMQEAAATEEVSDPEQLATAIAILLQDHDLRRRRVKAAAGVALKKHSILDDVVEELAPFLDTISPRQVTSAAPARRHVQS